MDLRKCVTRLFNNSLQKILLTTLFLITSVAASEFNDPHYIDQWYLKGEVFNFGGNFDIGYKNYLDNWNSTSKETYTVIIGTGVNTEHEDIAGALWSNPDEIPDNQIDDDNNGYLDDIHGINPSKLSGEIEESFGLSTAITGIIAAPANNNIGIVGMAPNSKVIHCKILDDQGIAYPEFLIACIDYVLHLKTDKNLEISSVVLDFLLSYRDEYFAQLVKSSFSKLMLENILVLSPAEYTEKPFFFPDVDIYPTFPAGYLMPNVINVSGVSSEGEVSYFGDRSIGAIANFDYIKTTRPDSDTKHLGPDLIKIEQDSHLIKSLQDVNKSAVKSTTGEYSWEIDINKGGEIIIKAIDLSDYADKDIAITFDLYAPQLTYINIYIQDANNPDWKPIGGLNTPSNDWQTYEVLLSDDNYFYFDTEKSAIEIKIAISQRNNANKEIYIDGLHLTEVTEVQNYDAYGYAYGQPVAMAQVAGAVALLKSSTELSNPEIRNLILSSGTTLDLPEYAAQPISLSNKLLSIYGNEHNGLFNCNQQTLAKRVFPSTEFLHYRVLGENITIKGLSLDCHEGQPMTVSNTLTKQEYKAKDDGEGLDEYPNDGYNITDIKLDTVGFQELEVTGDEALPLYVSLPYLNPLKSQLIWKERNTGEQTEIYNMKIGSMNQNYLGQFGSTPPLGTASFGKVSLLGAHSKIFVEKVNRESASSMTESREVSIEPTPQVASLPKNTNSVPFEPNFNYNGITAPGEEIITIYAFAMDTENPWRFMHPLTQIESFGEDGDRIFAVTFFPDSNKETSEFKNEIQLIFFEKNSTFIISYSDIDPAYSKLINKRGIKIGKHYTNFITSPFQNNASYLFKLDDGVNSHPIQEFSKISISPEKGSHIQLARLFTDKDGDKLFIHAEEIDGFTTDGFGMLELTKDFTKDNQSIIFNVSVTDGESKIESEFHLTFDGENSPPEQVKQFPEIALAANETFTLELNAYFKDIDGDALNFSIDSVGSGQQIDNNQHILISSSVSGDHSIALSVSDNNGGITITTLHYKINANSNAAQSQQSTASSSGSGGSMFVLLLILLIGTFTKSSLSRYIK